MAPAIVTEPLGRGNSYTQRQAFVAMHPPPCRFLVGKATQSLMIFCSTSTAPCSSASFCVLTVSGDNSSAINAPGRLVSSPGLSSHKSRALPLENYCGPLGVPQATFFPLASHYPCFTGTGLLGKRFTLIRKTRPLQKSSLPSPWIFTFPCHSANT